MTYFVKNLLYINCFKKFKSITCFVCLLPAWFFVTWVICSFSHLFIIVFMCVVYVLYMQCVWCTCCICTCVWFMCCIGTCVWCMCYICTCVWCMCCIGTCVVYVLYMHMCGARGDAGSLLILYLIPLKQGLLLALELGWQPPNPSYLPVFTSCSAEVKGTSSYFLQGC